ncbi:hypothetical protein ABZW49_15795 [Nonomuraea wenchangensis]
MRHHGAECAPRHLEKGGCCPSEPHEHHISPSPPPGANHFSDVRLPAQLGERPMGITWRLDEEMPADLFRRAAIAE